jgi:hypothetical protein
MDASVARSKRDISPTEHQIVLVPSTPSRGRRGGERGRALGGLLLRAFVGERAARRADPRGSLDALHVLPSQNRLSATREGSSVPPLSSIGAPTAAAG